MSNNHSAPPPPNFSAPPPNYPAPQPNYPQPPGNNPAPPQPPANYPAQPGNYPAPPQPPGNKKTLFIVLGAVAAAVVIALVAVFIWVIPAFNEAQAEPSPSPAVPSEAVSSDAAEGTAAPEGSALPEADASSDGMPAGAFPLPQGWDELQGPDNTPSQDDPLFKRFVTGESSFAYLASWSSDDTFGITKDPATGAPMQQVAKGTEERDGDGISKAFAFFAEAQEGKFGKEPAKVQAAIKNIQAKLASIPAAELPQHLVGHKCVSDFESTTPEIREFRRSAAVVVGFTCSNAGGDAIRAVNLFTVTPWGTPQMMGVSGHESYWSANPESLEKIANSYRANRWKLDG